MNHKNLYDKLYQGQSFESAMEKEIKLIRQVIKDEIKKVMGCGYPKNGYYTYLCLPYNTIKHVFSLAKVDSAIPVVQSTLKPAR